MFLHSATFSRVLSSIRFIGVNYYDFVHFLLLYHLSADVCLRPFCKSYSIGFGSLLILLLVLQSIVKNVALLLHKCSTNTTYVLHDYYIILTETR